MGQCYERGGGVELKPNEGSSEDSFAGGEARFTSLVQSEQIALARGRSQVGCLLVDSRASRHGSSE